LPADRGHSDAFGLHQLKRVSVRQDFCDQNVSACGAAALDRVWASDGLFDGVVISSAAPDPVRGGVAWRVEAGVSNPGVNLDDPGHGGVGRQLF
jgi:hypothetical protein